MRKSSNRIHRFFITMYFDLVIDNVVNKLTLQNKSGIILF
ncbi:hypothetical protein ASZ90_014806 [hydrocarbon metagenome]|uniref:Uncharacterized protein n=1 Tax=hydrocarbon metagenome TaxID=938273 RepID=A0A0W8F3Q2_9ZZZZ